MPSFAGIATAPARRFQGGNRVTFARVAQRRVDLDIEALGGLGVEVGVGPETAGMDAVDGAQIVDLVDVAGDAERADDLAIRIADKLAAAFEEQRPIGKFSQRRHEERLLPRFSAEPGATSG